MICFLLLCVISICLNSKLTICMNFTFGITNFINSIVYFLALLFVFLMILSNENVQNIGLFFGCFSVFFVVYGLNVYWSFILLLISKSLTPEPEIEDEFISI